PPGIDLDTFRPLTEVQSRGGVILAIGRTNPLKNLPLTIDSWRAMAPQPELWMFGIEPELGERYGARYVEAPTDEGVKELINTAGAFVQTSVHEGFCLPPLEAMAAGTPVVCTDAPGHRDFCRHEENCLLVEAEPHAIADALQRVLADDGLRRRLVDEGRETAAGYAWDKRIDELEAFLRSVAASAVLGEDAQPTSGVASPANGAAAQGSRTSP
ncbi:MAG: glycosyltransferase family 4 protein, partial [Solirubrobacterales bacterium]